MVKMILSVYDIWLVNVNREVYKISGLSIDEIPDFDYWQAYDNGLSPKVTAKKAIKSAQSF